MRPQELKSAVSGPDFDLIRVFLRNLETASPSLDARILPPSVRIALIELHFSK